MTRNLALIVVITSMFVAARPSAADDAPGSIDRGKTKKAIEAAEKRMAEYRLSHPLEKKKDDSGKFVPLWIVDEESPLTGKTGEFKGKFRKNDDDQVIVVSEPIKIGTAPDGSTDSRIVEATFHTDLKEYYDYNKTYDDHRMLKKQFKDQIDDLRHVLRIKLPAGHELPKKTHDHFEATLRVTAVEWDHAAVLPVLVIHSELVESKDFGLKK